MSGLKIALLEESTEFSDQKISYGTFPPEQPVSTEQANVTVGKFEVDRSRSLLAPGSFHSPQYFGNISRQCSIESGFESDNTPKTSPNSVSASPSKRAIPSRESQLLGEMEHNLTQAEKELEQISLVQDNDEYLKADIDFTSTVVTVNSDIADYNVIEIMDTYVSDTDKHQQYRSAFGVLCRLKRMIEVDCAKLDSLVGMDGSESVREQLETKGHQVRGRLDACLSEIDRRIMKVRQNNEIIIDGTCHRNHPIENPLLKSIRNSKVKCITWLYAMLFVSIISMIILMLLWNGSSDQWVVYIRLIRSPLIIILLLYLYGVNLKVWAKNGIDYIAIFNHHPDAVPTPKHIFSMAGFLTVVFSGLVIALIVASQFSEAMPVNIISLTMWLVLVAFVLSPFKYFLRKVRFNFLSVFVHILLAPCIFVFFSDFFLADQFNSTVAVFLDVHYTLCYFFSVPWTGKVDKGVCTSSGNGMRPIISFFPAMWRFLQCLRCFYDTYKVKHLINAGKYMTTLPVVVLATILATRLKEGSMFELILAKDARWIFILWAISSVVHSVYTFLWDVWCDWGLWLAPRCKVFRRPLIYRYKMLYILAILVDFILRFLWTLKLTIAILWQVDSDLVYTGMLK